MKKRFFTLLATVLSSAAVLVVSTASWTFWNQPETPEELLK
ncbi:cyclic lactone autoinducer peptide [Paenibacillus daejeonensis]|nr:cyclic lactone autoinducer peptide [Paenibacillus daejeonensis]